MGKKESRKRNKTLINGHDMTYVNLERYNFKTHNDKKKKKDLIIVLKGCFSPNSYVYGKRVRIKKEKILNKYLL